MSTPDTNPLPIGTQNLIATLNDALFQGCNKFFKEIHTALKEATDEYKAAYPPDTADNHHLRLMLYYGYLTEPLKGGFEVNLLLANMMGNLLKVHEVLVWKKASEPLDEAQKSEVLAVLTNGQQEIEKAKQDMEEIFCRVPGFRQALGNQNAGEDA